MPPLDGRMFRAFYDYMKAERKWTRSILERNTGIPHSSAANYMAQGNAGRLIQREIDFCLAGAMDGMRPLESQLYTDLIPWLTVASQAMEARLRPWSWRLGLMEGWIQEEEPEARPGAVAWISQREPLPRAG